MRKPRLLSLARASAEVTAGIPGRCAVSVRVLDDVTLRIHAGELLLVQGPELLGQSLLLAALLGPQHSPRHRYVCATRDVAPGLRIRRAALHADAVQEIMRGWQEAAVRPTAPASRTLYLLRASRGSDLTPRQAAEWRRWGRQAHERRDGVVIVCPPTTSLANHSVRRQPVRSAHEPAVSYGLNAAPDEAPEQARTIRLLELRAGRLHDARAPRRYSTHAERPTTDPTPHPWSARGSNAAHAPTAFRPTPKASPES